MPLNPRPLPILLIALCLCIGLAGQVAAAEVCQGYGPQTPRDIGDTAGSNPVTFSLAPPASEMNLCNIHFHKNAEHKGPGFGVDAGSGEFGGFRCDGAGQAGGEGEAVCQNVQVGDSVEVHWVFTSCDVAPGEGLGACSSAACGNPQLRVEAQVFQVVADGGLDFAEFSAAPEPMDGFHQPRALPGDTGEAVVFLGSTTGPSYNATTKCSPLQVTWSVRPQCSSLDAASLDTWCMDNPFAETKAQGVRELVTDPRLLSPIH